MPLRIAEGTSFAFPTPKPTTLAWLSHTTTRAEKLMFLPPLTTFVTRLIDTTCSLRFSDCGSMRFAITAMLELQSAFPGGVGEGLHPPVVQVAATVEDHSLDPRLDRLLRDLFAHGLRGRYVPAAFRAGSGRSHQGDALRIVNHLRVGMRQAAKHGEARALGRAAQLAANPLMHKLPNFVPGSFRNHYFLPPAPVLPTFFRSASPVYRTPLFL